MRKLQTKVPAKPSPAAVRSLRLTTEDMQLLERLRQKTGIQSTTELIRKALRDSAEKEKL